MSTRHIVIGITGGISTGKSTFCRHSPAQTLLARHLRSPTTVTNKWIANALGMGHPTAVSRSLGSDRIDEEQEASLRAALDR